MLPQEVVRTLVQGKQNGQVVTLPDVVEYGLVVVPWMVVVEHGFGQFFFKEFQGHQGEALVGHQYINPTERACQPCFLGESFFQVSRQGKFLVDGIVFAREAFFVQGVEYRKRKSIRAETDG